MKMLIVLGLREDDTRIQDIFSKAGIPVYSKFNTAGSVPNNQDLTDEWFAASGGETESVAYFSFTKNDRAAHALNLIRKANNEGQASHPFSGFILPVEVYTS